MHILCSRNRVVVDENRGVQQLYTSLETHKEGVDTRRCKDSVVIVGVP